MLLKLLSKMVRRRDCIVGWSTDRLHSTGSSAQHAWDKLRSKTNSDYVGDFNYRAFEDELFEMLSEGHGSYVELSRLLREIKNVGLRRTDKRLSECMTKISQLTAQHQEAGDIKLGRDMLKDVVKDNIVLLRRAFGGDFVIPDFPKFCGVLDEMYWACRSNTAGRVSSYLPQLSRQNPDQWAVALCTVDGQRHVIGDVDIPFTIQSGGRPVNYALAINELGEDAVHQFVGHEPSDEEATTAYVRLDRDGKPPNPLVNAGALVIASLLRSGSSLDSRYESTLAEYRRLTGGGYVSFNNSLLLEEHDVADHNQAIGYFLRQNRCFPAGVNLHETLDLYFQLCSTEITADSGSVIAATLANGGYCPTTGEQVLSAVSVRNTLSLMHSCGMYNYSGGFAFKVGLPSKSAISGAILLVVPNVLGLCLWSPSLDEMGNSVRGIQFCEHLVNVFNFHHYDKTCRRMSSSSVDEHLAAAPELNAVHHRDADGRSVVHLLFAAHNADLSGLRRFAISGYDMKAADYDGRTALHIAAAEGHLNCVQFLVEKCAVVPVVYDRWKQTPLDEARHFGRSDVVAYLEKVIESQSAQ